MPLGALPTQRNFTLAMALLEEWGNIPGLSSNPDNWDFRALPLGVLAWIVDEVIGDFGRAQRVPKKSLPPSAAGLTASNETTDGDTEPMT
jgi:hypothetical protein